MPRPGDDRQEALADFPLQLIDEAVELCRHSSHGLGLAEIDAGPLQVSADREKTVPFPPILGGICLVGGIVLVLAGNKKA